MLAFLSLALLPIGVIAVYQTDALTQQINTSTRLSLLALTEQAASNEGQVILRAFGAADAIAHTASSLLEDRDRCHAYIAGYQARHAYYSLIGLLRADGIMECSSRDDVFDFTGIPGMKELLIEGGPRVEVDRAAPISGESVIIVQQPYYQDEEFAGYVSISIPQRRVRTQAEPAPSVAPLGLITFNSKGKILTAERGFDTARESIPRNRTLESFVNTRRGVFVGENQRGEARIFAVVPIVHGVVYAMSTWSPDQPLGQIDRPGLATIIFPLLMWLVSLVVAYLALNRLVIVPVRALGRQMRSFARNRAFPETNVSYRMSEELLEMEDDFREMATAILQDEARMENAMREKNILLKEVHHRVKNNLQLILSIMNMQIRKSPDPTTRSILKRLQDRIMGLAAVHQALYKTENMTQINAGALIEDIVGKTLKAGIAPGAGIKVQTRFDPVILFPDQAVPLTMLTSEAVINALKYIGHRDGQQPVLDIRLTQTGPDEATLEVNNSIGEVVNDDNGTGLGQGLVRAFATQLGGEITVDEDENSYNFRLLFKIADFQPDTQDY